MKKTAVAVSYNEFEESKGEVESASPDQLPDPTGYRLLVAPITVDKKTEGGIYLPDERRDKESEASIVACVVKVGPDAYKDERKFPTGPWCKKGDYVIMPSYAGTRLLIHKMAFRIINDDTVQAVVDDPRGIGRA